MLASFEQCENAESPIVVTFAPMETEAKFEQFLNEFGSIVVTSFPMEISDKLQQSSNIDCPMSFTLLGIVMDAKFVH